MAVTDKELEASVLTAAKIVEAHGDAYMPIFAKLSDELDRRKVQRAKVTAHLRRCRLTNRRMVKEFDDL
ncbi:MAG: hypothetical protein COA43_10930 [Robiginitomaculum sp.]|nr:MAG: hypothetical protein COA43_10930 [Robiginitomaculum sp.]